MPQSCMRMPRLLDLGIGIHTCTAKMSASGGWGKSVFALLDFYWNVHISVFASNGSPIQNLVHTTSYLKQKILRV